MKLKNTILKAASAVSLHFAKTAYNSASVCDIYQPKAPKEMKKIKK